MLRGSVGPAAEADGLNGMTPGAFWLVWASFGILGGAFGATAWLTRPRVRRSAGSSARRDHEHGDLAPVAESQESQESQES